MSTPKTTAFRPIKLLGKKRGMTQMFDQHGALVPCTVIHAEPNIVTQIKTAATDAYDAIQVGFDEIRVHDARTIAKRTTQQRIGHFAKAQVAPQRHLAEMWVEDPTQYTVGQKLTVELFPEGTMVDVTGRSKGKGYQGVIKKYGFSGGPAAHGSGFHRHAGSTGMRSTPGRCLPGGPRPSHMGDERVVVQSLRILAIDVPNNLIFVRGAIPGARNSVVIVSQAIKQKKPRAARAA